MPDQDSLTKDPTQKLPLLCRCGCTDHSCVQRCCKQMNTCVHPCGRHPCSPCVHTCVHPCVSVHPWASRYKSAQPQRSGEDWVRKGANYSWKCHAVQSCTECFEQGCIGVYLHGVLWSVMARRWCSWCLAPRVYATFRRWAPLPSPVPLTCAPGRLRLRKCLSQGTNRHA